jgi:hypothetical protein
LLNNLKNSLKSSGSGIVGIEHLSNALDGKQAIVGRPAHPEGTISLVLVLEGGEFQDVSIDYRSVSSHFTD